MKFYSLILKLIAEAEKMRNITITKLHEFSTYLAEMKSRFGKQNESMDEFVEWLSDFLEDHPIFGQGVIGINLKKEGQCYSLFLNEEMFFRTKTLEEAIYMKIIGHTTFYLDYGINFENVATFITNTALIELKEKEIDLRRKTKLQKFFKK